MHRRKPGRILCQRRIPRVRISATRRRVLHRLRRRSTRSSRADVDEVMQGLARHRVKVVHQHDGGNDDGDVVVLPKPKTGGDHSLVASVAPPGACVPHEVDARDLHGVRVAGSTALARPLLADAPRATRPALRERILQLVRGECIVVLAQGAASSFQRSTARCHVLEVDDAQARHVRLGTWRRRVWPGDRAPRRQHIHNSAALRRLLVRTAFGRVGAIATVVTMRHGIVVNSSNESVKVLQINFLLRNRGLLQRRVLQRGRSYTGVGTASAGARPRSPGSHSAAKRIHPSLATRVQSRMSRSASGRVRYSLCRTRGAAQ